MHTLDITAVSWVSIYNHNGARWWKNNESPKYVFPEYMAIIKGVTSRLMGAVTLSHSHKHVEHQPNCPQRVPKAL